MPERPFLWAATALTSVTMTIEAPAFPSTKLHGQCEAADHEAGNVVEAAGVEPASEKARREKNYVRFRFGGCRPPH